jgi:putative transposase
MKKKDDTPKLRKGYKYSLRLTPHQRTLVDLFISGSNIVYNRALDVQMDQYKLYEEYVKEHGKEKAKEAEIVSKFSYPKLSLMYQPWRAEDSEEGRILRRCPTNMIVQKIKDLELAYRNFFRGDAQRPTRKIDQNPGSFRILIPEHYAPSEPYVFRKDEKVPFKFPLGVIRVPLLGKLTYWQSRPLLGTPKNITISRKADRYFVSIQTERDWDTEVPGVSEPKEIAIDFGLEPFISLSNGDQYFAPNPYQKYEDHLSDLTKCLKKCRNGSTKYKKYQLIFERLHRDIQFIREDWMHKLTTDIANRFDVVYIPDIKIKDWDTRKPKRKGLDEETKNQLSLDEKRSRKEIHKKLRDCAWEKFTRFLAYKLAERCATLIKTDIPKDPHVNSGPFFPYMNSSVENAQKLLERGKELSTEQN